MRLLNVTSLEFRTFDSYDRPSYAILSHRWETEEVTYADMTRLPLRHAKDKRGYVKLAKFCMRAKRDGLAWVWLDTCCIDKSSTAEVTEAITFMYHWYQEAEVCYVYMADVQLWKYDEPVVAKKLGMTVVEAKMGEIEKSEWWTRGWTLQELIAPRQLKFFGAGRPGWEFIGDKNSLLDLIHRRTNIDLDVLRGGSLEDCSVAKRMSWAAERETTRVEDKAYCLFGVFNVSLPVMYGEGERAFIRLQEEIMKHSDDQTLFAWNLHSEQTTFEVCGPLATSPSAFRGCGDLVPVPDSGMPAPYGMTNKGLRIELLAAQDQQQQRILAFLQCSTRDIFPTRLALPLMQVNHDEPYHFARDGRYVSLLPAARPDQIAAASTRTIFMRQEPRRKLDQAPRLLIAIHQDIVRTSRVTFADTPRGQLLSQADCPIWGGYYAMPGCNTGAIIILTGSIGIVVLFSIETSHVDQLQCKVLHTRQVHDDTNELRDLESDLGPMHVSKISKLVSDLSSESRTGSGESVSPAKGMFEQMIDLEHRYADEKVSETSVASLDDGRVVYATIADRVVEGANTRMLKIKVEGAD